MPSFTFQRVRLPVLLLTLAVATTATASHRHRPVARPLEIGDRVRDNDNVFGPTWYVIDKWEEDALIDNGTNQEYRPLRGIVLDDE